MGILDKLPILTTLAGDRTLRIAVTGLSRSGKTVFITSLVHNLSNAVGRPARLPFLRAAAERRILGARLLAPKADDLPSFPLDDTVAALAADPPHWPASTTDLRRMRLLLRFSTAGFLRAAGLLRGDAGALSLLRTNPFADRPPRYVRAQYYKYTFTTPDERRVTGRWWHRELVGAFTEPVTLPSR